MLRHLIPYFNCFVDQSVVVAFLPYDGLNDDKMWESGQNVTTPNEK